MTAVSGECLNLTLRDIAMFKIPDLFAKPSPLIGNPFFVHK